MVEVKERKVNLNCKIQSFLGKRNKSVEQNASCLLLTAQNYF
jgi:hypothetical protein